MELRALGPPSLLTSAEGDERRLVPVALQPKRLALLAWLVLARPRGFHRRDTLLALLWPESDAKQARNALNQALHGLRGTLGAEIVETRGLHEVAIRDGCIRCDVLELEHRLDDGRLADALELYRGTLLEGLHPSGASAFLDWVDAERIRLQALAREAAWTLADRAEHDANPLAAARWIERARAIAPDDERVVRRLISLRDAQGDRAGAVKAYETFARRMETEYETSPSPETRTLIDGVRQRTKRVVVPPSGDDAVPTLAVLPLDDLTGAGDLFFAEGMTETLTTELARLGNLRVISRRSASLLKAEDKPLAEIARLLAVDLFIEGSVLRSGDRIRVTVQLIRAQPEEHLWAETFDAELSDVLRLQRNIAGAVARQVERLTGHRPASPSSPAKTVRPRAWEAYLRGVVRFPYTTPETFPEVLGYFERAVELDPDFAEAYAWIAFAWVNAAYASACPLDVAETHARESVERAAHLSPELGSVQAIRATFLMVFERDWNEVDAAWRTALSSGDGNVHSYAAYVLFLGGMGRFDEALARARTAVRLDPLGAPEQLTVGWVHFRSRRYDDAVEQLAWTMSQWPDYPWTAGFLAASQLFGGWPAHAIDTCRRALPTAVVPMVRAYLAATLGRAGAVAEASAAIAELEGIVRTAFIDPYVLAVAHAGIGDHDAALADLERLVEHGSAHSWCIPVEVFFDPLRHDPRFTRVVSALSLPDLSDMGALGR